MLFVKLKTFHNNTKRRMPASAVKWVNLTAICVFLTVVLPSPANGFTPIGGGFQNGEGRKLFGGYRITPKHCRGTKTLPLTDPRSKGPTICMFNHECAQRNGEVVGACMDGFLFGACCQVPLSNANENTLIKDAQNPFYQTHSTEAYESVQGSSQKLESNEFQEIQTTSTKYQDLTTTESSYLEELVSQKIHKANKTSSSNKVFYVNKGSVMVSSPSSLSHNDDYVMLSSSTSQSPFNGGNNNRVSFTTELPMKISTDLVDNEDSTQLPILLTETAEIKKNYSSGPLDLDMGEFTHSDITHPGAESVLIDNDLQFSTGFGGPQSVYVPPPAHAEIIPPKRRPAQRPSINGPSKKPSNDKYVLIQTLEASKKPSQSSGTTSTGISTNIDSIESIILMLNGTNHGPSYDVANTSPTYNQQKPSYGQNQGYGTTHRPAGQTYVPVTTVRPIVTVTTGSGVVLSDHVSTTTPEPTYYEEAYTRRPTTSFVQESTEQTSNKYHSVEMSDEKPSFVEIPSPPHKLISDKVDSGPPAGPSQDSYNVASGQINHESNPDSQKHNDASNPDYGYTSPAQPTSDFNKMPAVGEAYPVMDEETSAYFESSMLSEEQASNQNSQQTNEVADKNAPTYAQSSQQQGGYTPQSTEQSSQNQVQAQLGYPSQQNNVQYNEDSNQNKLQPQENLKRPQFSYEQNVQSQSGYVSQSNRPIPQENKVQASHHRPSSQIPNQNYEQLVHNRPSSTTQDYQQAAHNRPSPQLDTQDYQQISHNRPSSQAPTHNSQQVTHNRPSPQSSNQAFNQVTQNRPSPQPSTQNNQKITHNRPSPQPSNQVYDQDSQNRPSPQPVTQNFQQITQKRPSPQPSNQGYDQVTQKRPNPTQKYEQIVQNKPSSQRPPQDYEQIAQTGYISHSTTPHVYIRPTTQVLTTSFEVQSPNNRPGTQTQNGYLSQSSTTHIVRPTTQVVTHAYEVEDQNSYDSNSPEPTQQLNDDIQDEYDQVRPSSQLVTQSYDTSQQSDYVSQSSEADKETYQTPESQLIAQLTDHIKNGYLSNPRPTVQLSQDQYNEGYLSRPTPQSTKVQAGYFENTDQSTARPGAQVVNQNNQILAQAGYFSQPPNFEKIQPPPRPTLQPNRISTLIVQQQSTTRPTKPTKVHTAAYSDIETNYPNPTQSTEHSTISSTSRPVATSSSARPTKRPTKRVTKRPSVQKKPSTNKVQQSTQSYGQPAPPQKLSGTPSNQANKLVTTKHPLKKQPPSTSYVTGPTTPRPEVEVTYVQNPPPTPIADKVDSFITSSQTPTYNSIYLASPTDEIILQNAPTTSNHHNYNKPLFVKIPSATQKPPSPTVIITPKPTVVNLITASSSSKRPTTTPIPTFAGSNSYVYSPLITRRPEYSSSTQEYINIPQVTSNDFDDPGYSGLHTLTTQVLNKIPTDDRPAFPGYYGPTPSYPTFQLPSDKYSDINEEEEETYTSPNDFVNFPPVRNPNLNMSATSSSVTNDLELSTPAFVEDTILKDKMNTLVHKIVESLQSNFEALADMIDENNNTVAGFSETTLPTTTIVTRRPTSKPPTRKPVTKPSSSAKPTRVSTKRPPTRVSTSSTTRRPTVTTRRPVATTRRSTTKRPVTRKPTRKATTTTTSVPIQEDEIVEEEEDVNNEVDSNTDENENERKFQCGVRPHVKSGRIVGGKGSTFGEFPWQVLVRESTWLGLFTKNKCGGVLITNKYVVTAAHCQPGFLASLVAVMGEYDISGDLESKRSVTKNVKRVIVHRQYDPATFENDLALLELESAVNYDSHIVPICMPADTADFTGRMATVTGWGRLKYGGGVPSVLQEVQVPIIENSVCQEMFHTAGHNKKILQSFLCAGYANGQKDSCEGDSGGPLVLQRPDGRYELAGTVSHGIKCAAPYLPGVYMRTTYYKPWLRSITGVK